MRGAKLYGAGISLTCDTFAGLKLDDQQVALLLLMIAMADITPAWREGLMTLVTSVIGIERNSVLARYLTIHA